MEERSYALDSQSQDAGALLERLQTQKADLEKQVQKMEKETHDLHHDLEVTKLELSQKDQSLMSFEERAAQLQTELAQVHADSMKRFRTVIQQAAIYESYFTCGGNYFYAVTTKLSGYYTRLIHT